MTDFTQRRLTMVDTQVRPSDVTSFTVIDAMLAVPRERYVPDGLQDLAYVGGAVPLPGDRHLMEPRSIGMILEALDLTPADLVLEIGPGLGYTTALMAQIAEAVVAVEEDPGLAADAEATLNAEGVDNAVVFTGPLVEGCPDQAPFDVIVAFGGVETWPEALSDQLKEGGRALAVFMDGPLGEARLGLKRNGHVAWRMAFNATAPILPGFAKARSFEF